MSKESVQVAAHREMSSDNQWKFGYFSRPFRTISSELSSAVTSASGHKDAMTSVLFPGPEPRSMIRRGRAAEIRDARSRHGRVRSASNFKY
jgi:hypothetical protein